MSQGVIETNFPGLTLVKRGKVRDMYDLGEHLLMVATDRISAFDVVMPDPVPDKGKILTQISLYWFTEMADLVPNHVVSADVNDYPEACKPYADILRGRSIMVKKAQPLDIECVVRGYISGSGWNSYKKDGTVCGIKLPAGLKESEKLPTPLFTPSTKAPMGSHDENIDFDTAAKIIGADLAAQVRDVSLALYEQGAEIALKKGIIIADTKFEFGLMDGQLILIDEVLTPDSSRFWPVEGYAPGGSPKSFDKQYLRDYLLTLSWDKTPPGPSLPEEVLLNTRAKYLEALQLLAGPDYVV